MGEVILTCFELDLELTYFLVVYTKSFFEELDYVPKEEELLPGLVFLTFLTGIQN